MKFDVEVFREQARSGMQGAYLMFQDGDGEVLGYLGPFKGGTEAAKVWASAWLAVEKKTVDDVDSESPWAMYPYFFHEVKVVELTPHEIECLSNPEKEKESDDGHE